MHAAREGSERRGEEVRQVERWIWVRVGGEKDLHMNILRGQGEIN